MSDYDPADHTVDEVLAYVSKHPDEADDILAAEQAGKGRVTLIDQLDADDDDDEPVAATLPAPGQQATTTDTKDYNGRLLLTPGTVAKDYMGRLVLTGDLDYMGRATVT